MGSLVPCKEAQMAKALPTMLTFIDPLGQVQPLMDAEALGPPEGLPTLRAGVGLLTTVDPLVVVEILLSAEVLAADGTVERSLISMHQLVTQQVRFLFKGLATGTTLVGPVPCVHLAVLH